MDALFSTFRKPPVGWREPLTGWALALTAQGCTVLTVKQWWYIVSHFALRVDKPVCEVTSEDVIVYLNRGVGNAAMRSDHNALTSFFRWAVNAGVVTDNVMTGLKPPKRRKRLQPPAPVENVLHGLTCTDEATRLTVMLMDSLGLRRNEVAGLHTRDIIKNPDGTWFIRIHGKGDKDRILPVPAKVKSMLRVLPDGWFFPSATSRTGHISADTVYARVKKTTGLACHSIRRKFATDLWKATGDVLKVKEFLGHESLDTTQHYLYTTSTDLESALSALDSYRHY